MRVRLSKILTVLFFTAASIYILGCGISLFRFPNEIRLTEHSTHRLSFDIPFSATFQSETAAVFKINDHSLADDPTVSLQKPLTIETDGVCTADMIINAFGVPVKKVTLEVVPDMELVPCGMTIGVRINTDGIMVLGSSSFKGADGQTYKPSEGKLKPGDLILSANGKDLKNKEDLTEAIAQSGGGEIKFCIRREEQLLDVTVQPEAADRDNAQRIGIWVRDSTQGIGTITYYNPSTHAFGALGHGIMDVDTKSLMSVKNGVIMSSTVTSVKKGAKGTPGELEGAVKNDRVLGQIKTNSPQGIYGMMEQTMEKGLPKDTVKMAARSQTHEGPAVIRTNIASNVVKEYDIYIESVNRYALDETKSMVIRITDPELLKMTNGIVQGMSGSPILQDGRIAGAVTHVFVQDPSKGYGIFIENMIKQEQSVFQ